MTIYLVRHTEYFNPDNIYAFHLPVQLSPEGEVHAQRIGQWFKEKNVGNLPIFTSPILRTVQTSQIIASFTNSTIEEDERLIEIFCPNLQGVKKPSDEKQVLELEMNDESREPTKLAQKRMIECFDEKVREGKDCVLVSHGDPLTALYYHLTDKELPYCLFDDKHIDTYIKRGEIVCVYIEDNNYQIERVKV